MDRPCWRSLLALLMLPPHSLPAHRPAELPFHSQSSEGGHRLCRDGDFDRRQDHLRVVNLSTIDAVLVSVGGETKVAHNRNGSKPEEALHVYSVTKSVASALIGIAIDEKIISGLDATFPNSCLVTESI